MFLRRPNASESYGALQRALLFRSDSATMGYRRPLRWESVQCTGDDLLAPWAARVQLSRRRIRGRRHCLRSRRARRQRLLASALVNPPVPASKLASVSALTYAAGPRD